MKIKRTIWIIIGFISLSLGAIGAAVPMIPSVPFLMITLFCFGRSSKKLHHWFINTNLYKNNLESFVNGEGMTCHTKIKIIIMTTILMGIGIFMMMRAHVYIPSIILIVIWMLHIIYFVFYVKTLDLSNNKKTGTL